MTSEPRGDEAFAASVVRRVLGVEVLPLEHRDEHPRPVDFEVVYPDGRRAPLEVTWLTTSRGRALDDQLARMHHQLPHHGDHNWFAEVQSPLELRRLRVSYQHLIDVLDVWGASTWQDLPPHLVAADPDVMWLARSGAALTRAWEDGDAHPVYVFSGSISAIWAEGADVITPAVQDALQESSIVQSHLQKLLEHAGDQRHLFLIADLDGLTPEASMELHDAVAPPAGELHLPTGLTHLWLLPRFGSSVLLATDHSWQVHRIREFPSE